MKPKPTGSIPAGIRLALILAAAALAVSTSRAPESRQVTIQRGVAVKMRDGAVPRADIYRTKANGKFPALLERGDDGGLMDWFVGSGIASPASRLDIYQKLVYFRCGLGCRLHVEGTEAPR